MTKKESRSKGVVVYTDPEVSEWKSVLEKRGEGDYRQTPEYIDAMRRARPHSRALVLAAKQDGEAVGVLAGLHSSHPFYGGTLVVGGSSGGGPVIASSRCDEEVVSLVLREVARMCRKRMVADCLLYWFDRWGHIDSFLRTGFRIRRRASIYIVPLCEDPTVAWRRLVSNKRRKVRQAQRRGIEVRVSTSASDFSRMYLLEKAFASEKGFEPPPLREIESVWRAFVGAGMARVFLAESEDELVASALVYTHLDTVFCPYTSSSPAGRLARANDMLHWKIIEWGCLTGHKKYNMGEVFPDPIHPQHGVYRWKAEYRGYIEPMTIFERHFDPVRPMLRGWLRRLRQLQAAS